MALQENDREDLLSEALTLAFGRPLAGLLLTLGVAMNISGSIEFGQHSFENVVHLGDSWLDNPTAVDEAITAATTLLNSVRPRGDISEARTDAGHATAKAIIALVDGVHMIRSLVRSEPGRLNYQVGLKLSDGVVVPMKIKADVVEAPKIRSLLGPLQLRMARYIDDSEK